MALQSLTINGRVIGLGQPTYIIAEMSANHGQDFERAVEIVRAAKAAGADAIKLQTLTPAGITFDSDASHFRVGGGTLWDGRTLFDLYGESAMPWEWQPRLADVAREIGIDLFSSPFDETAVDFLESMAAPAYKIASFEIVDLPLIRRVSRTGRPVIMSTGMATLGEIEDALTAAAQAGATEVALLKCTSAYPAPPAEMNLRGIPHLASVFGVPVGLSDHSEGPEAAIAAVSIGACIIEKHFTLSRSLPGPDSAFSVEPDEFRRMVDAIRTVEAALGQSRYEVGGSEQSSRAFRRSLFIVQDVKAGDVLTAAHVRSIRPGHGLAPKFWDDVVGHVAACDIAAGTPLTWAMVGP